MKENVLHREIVSLLHKEKASYTVPVNSEYIGKALGISPSYVRTQMCSLMKVKLVAVRRGNSGGYYLMGEKKMEKVNSNLIDKSEVLMDSLQYMIQYTERLTTGLREMAILLQTGLENKAFEKLPDAVDGMSLMVQLLNNCIAAIDLESIQVEHCIATIHLLGDQIGVMNLAIERKDYGTLADQCEYELVEIIEEKVKPVLILCSQFVENKHIV